MAARIHPRYHQAAGTTKNPTEPQPVLRTAGLIGRFTIPVQQRTVFPRQGLPTQPSPTASACLFLGPTFTNFTGWSSSQSTSGSTASNGNSSITAPVCSTINGSSSSNNSTETASSNTNNISGGESSSSSSSPPPPPPPSSSSSPPPPPTQQQAPLQPVKPCELHFIPNCEWCQLGVKYRNMYGRWWPYAEDPATHKHYCLEPVENPASGRAPCCALRREPPIKSSQGYAGHLASHRTSSPQHLCCVNAAAVAKVAVVASSSSPASSSSSSSASSSSSSSSSLPGAADKLLPKRARRHSGGTPPAPWSHTTLAFKPSLQPSLPRCVLQDFVLRFFLLPPDNQAEAISVVFKGHREELFRKALRDDDGIFDVDCPLISELLPPDDTRTTFEVQVRAWDIKHKRCLYHTSILFTAPSGPALHSPLQHNHDVPTAHQIDPELLSSRKRKWIEEEHEQQHESHRMGGQDQQQTTMEKHQHQLQQRQTKIEGPASMGKQQQQQAKMEEQNQMSIEEGLQQEGLQHVNAGEEEEQEKEEESQEISLPQYELGDMQEEDIDAQEETPTMTIEEEIDEENGVEEVKGNRQAGGQETETPEWGDIEVKQEANLVREMIKQASMGVHEEEQQKGYHHQQQLQQERENDQGQPNTNDLMDKIEDEDPENEPQHEQSFGEEKDQKNGFETPVDRLRELASVALAESDHCMSAGTLRPFPPSFPGLPHWSTLDVDLIPPPTCNPYIRPHQKLMPAGMQQLQHPIMSGLQHPGSAYPPFIFPTSFFLPPKMALPPHPPIVSARTLQSSTSVDDTTMKAASSVCSSTMAKATHTLSPFSSSFSSPERESEAPPTAVPQLNLSERCRFYFYTVLPEKGKLIWVVFFSQRLHSLEPYELILQEAPTSPAASETTTYRTDFGYQPKPSLSSSSSSSSYSSSPSSSPSSKPSFSPPPSSFASLPCSAAAAPSQSLASMMTKLRPTSVVLPPMLHLAWIAEGRDPKTGERIYQHKICFQAPDSTFERRIFAALLRHQTDQTLTLLGGMSFVSTTSQRNHMWARINQCFPGKAHQHLVRNCSEHPPSRRHFFNGKGSGQGSKLNQKDRFLPDELDKSIELDFIPF